MRGKEVSERLIPTRGGISGDILGDPSLDMHRRGKRIGERG